MSALHIGKKIKQVVKEGRIPVTEFAKSINITRDGVYKIFAKENIDTAQLRQISKALNYDFFKFYSASLTAVKEGKDSYGYATKEELHILTDTVTKLVKEIEKLREQLPAKKSSSKKTTRKK